MIKMKKPIFFLLIIVISIIMFSACAREEDNTITIAEQYGLAYAPVQIMKDKKILEENLVGMKIRWKRLANTAAIREAVLAGEVDIGFMAIPPFLIGKDKGMDWKIISGLSMSPLGLMTYKEDLEKAWQISAKTTALPYLNQVVSNIFYWPWQRRESLVILVVLMINLLQWLIPME